MGRCLRLLHRLMVGQRTLTPLILVRIQVKQPIKKRPVAGVFLLAEKYLSNGEGRGSNRARAAFCSGIFPARRSAGEV